MAIMDSIRRKFSKDEFARRGDALFKDQVRPRLTAADAGKFAAIDIESGAFEVDGDEFEAGQNLRARIPDAQVWIVRIGSRSVRRFGGRERRGTR
jgi:hypothetical protein